MREKQLLLDILMFPGLLLHELAHAIMVLLVPTATIESFNVSLTNGGEVEYEYAPTATKTFLISFAPLGINTAIATGLVYLISNSQGASLSNPLAIIATITYTVLSLSILANSLPSYQDSISTIRVLRSQLISLKFPLVITIGLIFFTFCLPAVIFSKVLQTNRYSYYGISLLYGVLTLGLMYGLMNGYIETQPLLDTAETAVQNVHQYLKTQLESAN